MTENELKNAISSILREPHSSQLYLILKINNDFVLRLVDLDNTITEPEIQRMFIEFLENSIVLNEEMTIRKLSEADESPNVIYEYDYESYPEELTLFKQFDIKTATSEVKHFNFKKDSLNHLFGFLIYIGDMNNGTLLFKKHYPYFLIKRGSLLFKCSERFVKLESDDILRMNNDAQLLRVNNTIFVLNLKVLERNMGFSELIHQAANEAIDAIESLGVLDDIEVLRDTVEEPSFARKLSKVKKTSPIFQLGISKTRIIDFTKNTPELVGKFKYSEDETQIRLGTKKSKLTFIKLMQDSFLHSTLTKQWYETSAKDNITKKDT